MEALVLLGTLALFGCAEPREPKTLTCDERVISKTVIQVDFISGESLVRYKTKESAPSWAGFVANPTSCELKP